MRIPDTIIALPILSIAVRQTVATASAYESPFQDTLDISEVAQQKIDQLQQANDALQQAVTQSRQAARAAALERVGYIKEYLKNLLRMAPPGDRAAADEAARMAREIKSAAAEFRSGIATGMETDTGVRSEITGFAEVAGDALKIAKGLIASYLQRRKTGQNGDSYLEKEINGAVSAVRDMVNKAMPPT